MASIIYSLMLFIFIFGAGMTFMTDSGIYSMKMANQGLASNISQAQGMNTAMLESSKDSNMNYIQMLSIMGSSLVGGVMAVVTLGPLMISLGVPPNLAVFFISPLGVVLAFWLIEMWLGRPAE
jgi:hypothetical protein